MATLLNRYRYLLLAAGLLVPLAAGAALLRVASDGPDSSDTHRVTQVVGGPFTLTAGDGRIVGPGSWPGKLLLIAFGYSYCPDICPTTLGTIARALDQLGPDAARIQPLFISVDPDRDTPETLRRYAAMFHPSLIGLTGTKTQITEAARSFRVYFQKVKGATPESYTMDHTAFYFAANDHGSVIRIFDHNAPPKKVAEQLKELLSRAVL